MKHFITKIIVLSVWLFYSLGGCKPTASNNDALHIAVASNFLLPMQNIAKLFEVENKMKIVISSASTGKLYAQIKNGAPYDLFFSADERAPKLLEAQKLIVLGSRFTYAYGKLVLYNPSRRLIPLSRRDNLNTLKHFAIANYQLAPYGKAAKSVLSNLHLWEELSGKLVIAENVNQAYHYVQSGNAEAGFVAASQVQRVLKEKIWLVPQELYPTIKQQAVLLHESQRALTFIDFIKSKRIKEMIVNFGYFQK